jgi:hypothetical protein
MSFKRTKLSRGNFGYPFIKQGNTVVRYGIFHESSAQWPMLPPGVLINIAEWSCREIGAERGQRLAFCLRLTEINPKEIL